MKMFWICCLVALCLLLSGCAGFQQKERQEETPNQADARQEVLDKEPEFPLREEGPEVPAEPDAVKETEENDAFVGKWHASDSSQCDMDIKRGDEGNYTIEIIKRRDPQEAAVWVLTGTYDEIWEGIDYIGAKYEEITGENGNAERVPVPEREEVTGLIFFKNDGILNWEEIFDHAGDDLDFVKE